MKDEKTIELINQEIDGLNSPEESSALKARMESDAEIRNLYEELSTLSDALKNMQTEEPPESLLPNVMSAVRQKISERKKEKTSTAENFSNIISGYFRVRYAFSFVAGVAATILIISLFFDGFLSGTLDENSLTGTFTEEGLLASFEKTDEKNFHLTGAGGNVETARFQKRLLVKINLTSNAGSTVRLSFDPHPLLFHSFVQTADAEPAIEIRPDHVSFEHTGENTYLLFFDDGNETETSLLLEVNIDNEVFEARFKTR